MPRESKKLNIGLYTGNVRAVAFDKDGTLFDSVQFWSQIDELRKVAFLNLVGPAYENEWSRMMGFEQPDRVDFAGVLAVASTVEEIVLTAGLLYRIKGWPWTECRQKARDLFADADKSLILDQAFRPNENVPDIFHLLHGSGIATGILTSDAYARTSALMTTLGIDRLLDFLITPEQVSKGKPDPEMVNQICRQLRIPPSELAVVGDSVVDLQMAKAAGSIAVGLVTYEGSERELAPYADVLIRSLCEIRVS